VLQEAFWESMVCNVASAHLGILTTMSYFLRQNPAPTRTEIREAFIGNICRVYRYQNIVTAVEKACTLRSSTVINGASFDGNR